jgi:hypothetical protein
MPVRIFFRRPFDLTLFVGPYVCRLCLSRYGSFAYQGDVVNRPILRFVRRFWSGWSRWQ